MGFRILGIDSEEKESFVKECGAEEFVSLNKYPRGAEGDTQIAEAIKKATGGGAAAVIVCTAVPAAYNQALDFLKFNGVLVCVGILEGDTEPMKNANPNRLIVQQLTITGSAVGNRREAVETLDMAARGVVKTKFTVHGLEELGGIFEKMEQGKLMGRAVIAL